LTDDVGAPREAGNGVRRHRAPAALRLIDIPLCGARCNCPASRLCITKLDVLDGLKSIKVCTSYETDGKPVELVPTGPDAVARCRPVYETLPGWTESTVGARSFDVLPKAARAYLDRLEHLAGVPIAMVSTGPDRDETIRRQHPFH
jgi:adenylosuccinate synthase